MDFTAIGIAMGGRRGVWVFALAAVGCHTMAGPTARPPEPTVTPLVRDLPLTSPIIPILDARDLPSLPDRTQRGPQGTVFRRVNERDCLALAADRTASVGLLQSEDQIPPTQGQCNAKAELRHTVSYYSTLELRNRAAAEALDRFFQLAELEARTDLLRKSIAIVEELAAKATSAGDANVRFPLELADLRRQRSQLESQLEQAELGSNLLNLDLKRRLGLPYAPAAERLWPVGDFAIDPTPWDVDAAANAALADRPELRGVREFNRGLTVETLPDARDVLRAASPLLGLGTSDGEPRLPRLLNRLLGRKSASDVAKVAELEVRKKQLSDLTLERERIAADEARAAALTANSQRIRASHARDRVASWEEKLAEAERKRSAAQPGAEFLVPQVRLELLKARSDLISEVAAWHRARISLKAAEGWLAWEAASMAK